MDGLSSGGASKRGSWQYSKRASHTSLNSRASRDITVLGTTFVLETNYSSPSPSFTMTNDSRTDVEVFGTTFILETGNLETGIYSSPSASFVTTDGSGTYYEDDVDPVGTLPKSSENEIYEPQATTHISPLREVAFVGTICMTQIMSWAGLLQCLAPLHIIGHSLGVTDPGRLNWFIAAFSLAFGTFVLPAGRLGDMYGHKKILMAGWVWYAVWSLVAGVSVYSGPMLFTVARALQGIGPALLIPNALAMVGRFYPFGKKRNIIFSLFGACAPIGATLGALFSSIFSQLLWWSWTFWATSIACAIWFCTSYLMLPPDEITIETEGSRPIFDYVGCLTGVCGFVLVSFAWNQAGVVGWREPYTYTILIVGAILLAGFFYIESSLAEYALIPFRSLSRESGLVIVSMAAAWASLGIWLFYSFQFFEILRGHSPLSTTARIAPIAISGIIASIASGILISKFGAAKIMLISMLAFVAAQVLFATAPVHQTYWAQTFVSTVIMPWGMILSFPTSIIILSNSLPVEYEGLSAGLLIAVANYSISIGLGIAGTITKNFDRNAMYMLDGYRDAWYLAIGLDALGVAFAVCCIWFSRSN